MKNHTELTLGDDVYISIIWHIPNSLLHFLLYLMKMVASSPLDDAARAISKKTFFFFVKDENLCNAS